MQHVCVLIAAPGSGAIDDAFVSEARTLCDADGNWRWLDRSQALEIGTHDRGRPKAELLTRMREAIADRPIDSAIVPVNHRRKHLLVADMDSTMIEQECIDELAYMVGEKERVSAITERAMRGEIAFEPSVRERVAILKGLPISIIDRVMDERIT
ncbi:MAG: phosphoserine phosphatase SerB, partial [Pseudomonadota bacterium]